MIIPEFDAGEAVASVFILLDGGWASDILSPSEKYYEIIELNYNLFQRFKTMNRLVIVATYPKLTVIWRHFFISC